MKDAQKACWGTVGAATTPVFGKLFMYNFKLLLDMEDGFREFQFTVSHALEEELTTRKRGAKIGAWE